MAIRVLRIIEYIYEDAKTAEQDMRNWNAPADGMISMGSHSKMQIRSTTITDLDFEFDSEGEHGNSQV